MGESVGSWRRGEKQGNDNRLNKYNKMLPMLSPCRGVSTR